MARLRRRRTEKQLTSQTGAWTTEEDIARALRKSGGIQTAAGKMIGVGQSAISQRISKSAFLQKTVSEIKEQTLDFAESQLMTKIKEGHIAAIIFYLKTQGKHRGYSERAEIDINAEFTGGVLIVPGVAKSVEEWQASYQAYVESGVNQHQPLTDRSPRKEITNANHNNEN